MLCDNLRAYLDNELTPPEAVVMRVHSRFCPTCRRNTAVWSCISKEIKLAEDGPELQSLRERLMADARTASARARLSMSTASRPRTRQMAPYFAGLLAAVLILFFIVRAIIMVPSPARKDSTVVNAPDRTSTNGDQIPRGLVDPEKPQDAHSGITTSNARPKRTGRPSGQRHLQQQTRQAEIAANVDLSIELPLYETPSRPVLAARGDTWTGARSWERDAVLANQHRRFGPDTSEDPDFSVPERFRKTTTAM
jgi:hypothetical protein